MLLTRLIKRQLVVFAVLAIAALGFTSVVYAQLPQRLGIGYDTVTIDFTDASGLYTSAIVTYRGVKVGKVTDLELRNEGAVATVTLTDKWKIPKSAVAELHSTSAIGEQYIDLVPTSAQGPYLEAGDRIAETQSRPMPQIAPVLDKLNGLLESVPTADTESLLKEVNSGLGGAGNDVGGLVDASNELLATAQEQIGATRELIEAADPVLATQQQVAGNVLNYSEALSSFIGEVADKRSDLTRLLTVGPGALTRTSTTVDALSEPLPQFLAGLSTNAEVLNVYVDNLDQVFSVYPALAAGAQSLLYPHIKDGAAGLDLRVAANDPPPCIKGYVPTAQRRSPTSPSGQSPVSTAS